jgi:hypothetical protein
MNYKKNILSLAAIVALSTSAYADSRATYTPLTNTTNDNAWIMFGVNGFANGLPSETNTNGVFTNGYDTVQEDNLGDNLATPFEGIGATANANGTGLYPSTAASGAKNMATIQAIKDATGTPYFSGTSLVVAIESSTSLYSETQPVRSMYIAIEPADTISKIKLDYKAALEGKTFEIQIDGVGTVYKGTISETATFNNPAVARDITPVIEGTEKTTPEDTLVYDMSKAPIDAQAYDITKHQGDTLGAERFYHYDSATQTWILWDRANDNGENSLTTFEKGKAYWGRIDTSGATGDQNSSTSDTRAGLYLGNNTGLDEADPAVYIGKLTSDAWNMMAFDAAKNPDIRNATTGLIIDINTDFDDGDTIDILDETLQNGLTVTFDTDNTVGKDVAQFINKSIEIAKILGKLPSTFNIKVFNITDTKFAFLSDKKFTVKDGTNTKLTTSTTLAGKDPISTATGLPDSTVAADVPTTGASSAYGEYALIVEPLVGDNTASQLDSLYATGSGSVGSAAVQLGNIEGDTDTKTLLGTDDTATDLATAQTAFVANEIFAVGGNLPTDSTGQVFEIDTDTNGTTDMLLLATDKAFYIKDNTFTRVYSVDASNAQDQNITIQPDSQVVTIGGNAIGDIRDAIDTLADTTEVYAEIDPNDTTKLVVVDKDSPLLKIDDIDSATIDLFSSSDSDSNLAKGAIKQVVDVAKLVRTDLGRNQFVITFTADANGTDEGNGDNAISVNGVAATDTVIDTATTTDTLRIAMLESFSDKINVAMSTANIAGFAAYDYKDGTDDITKATITITGVGIDTVVFNEDDGTLAATVGADSGTNIGVLDTAGALLTSNLKANAIYTPDYVNAGPLYTLRNAGYEAKALIKPTTKLADTPTTQWDHIDLTRDSKDWLKDNEYNLFSIDSSSGYWAYVVDNAAAATISVGTKVFTPSYTHHFNPITDNTENLIDGGTVSIEVFDSTQDSGYLNAETSNAKLLVNGSEVQLMKSGTSFTAKLTTAETGLAPSTEPISIGLKVADGLGQSFTDSALFTLDYTKPEAPTATFNANEMTLSSISTDAASYYVWEDFIPDNLTSPLITQATGAINMCFSTAFGDVTALKAITIDGTGDIDTANASNALSFTYENVTKSATVLTHGYGDATSSVVVYDDACVLTADTTTKDGIDIRALSIGTVRMSFQAVTGTIDATTDIPFTAYFDIPATNAGVKVIEVVYFEAYANTPIYVQVGDALYSGTLPNTRDLADTTFTSPAPLTALSSANQTLAQ